MFATTSFFARFVDGEESDMDNPESDDVRLGAKLRGLAGVVSVEERSMISPFLKPELMFGGRFGLLKPGVENEGRLPALLTRTITIVSSRHARIKSVLAHSSTVMLLPV